MSKRFKSNRREASTVKIEAMSSEYEQLKVRLDRDLMDAIRASSKRSDRSITAEVAARLRMSYDLEGAARSGFGRPLGLTEAELVRMIDQRLKLAIKQGRPQEG